MDFGSLLIRAQYVIGEMVTNEQLIEQCNEFLRTYYTLRGIGSVECEALACVRRRAEVAKERYKKARDGVQAKADGSRRVRKNRRATKAAKVRDEVYKRELAAELRRAELRCAWQCQEIRRKRSALHDARQANHALRKKVALLEQSERVRKESARLIADNLGETYEERRRAGFVCPSLFGDASDVVRYGGELPRFSEE